MEFEEQGVEERREERQEKEIQQQTKEGEEGQTEKQKKSGAARWKKTKELLKKFWSWFKWILLVVVVFGALALVSWYNSRKSKRLSPYYLERIRTMLQFASKSADEAERISQDEPVQALLHANYAVVYFAAAKHLVDDRTIESLIGTNLQELDAYLKALQQRLLVKIYGVVEQAS